MNWALSIPLFIYLIGIFFIGLWANCYVQKTASFIKEYFIGSRSLGGFILAMTMMATYGSASSFIGGPGIAYQTGLGWVLLSMAQLPAGYFVLTVLGKKFAILARQYDAVTLTDFLKARYQSNTVAIFSTLSIIIFLFSSMAAQWVGGARLLESIFGISYTTALIIFAVSVIVYVVIGGFRAVSFTDAIQGSVMFFGTMILLVAVIVAGGGIENIMMTLVEENPYLISPFGADGNLTPLYVSSYWILVGVGLVGLPQLAVRAMSYKDSQALHRGIIYNTVFVGVIMFGMHLIGVFARAVHPGIVNGDHVMPTITMEVLPPLLAGIVLAAPLAAIMSTVDALLITVSSAVVKDIYLGFINPEATEREIKIGSFLTTAIIGIIVFFIALSPPDFLIWLNLFAFGGLESTFIWPVFFGLYWNKANHYGAISAMIIGMTSYILLDQLYPNAFGMHTVVVPILLSCISFVLASWMTSGKGTIQSFKHR